MTGIHRFVTNLVSLPKFLPTVIKFNSIRFKVSVLYTAVLGIILVIFSTVLYVILAYYLYQDIDNSLKLKSREISETIEAYAAIVGDKPGALEFAVEKTFFYDTGDFPVSLFDLVRLKHLDNHWHQTADTIGLNNSYIAFIFADGQAEFRSKNFPPKLLSTFLKLTKISVHHRNLAFNNVRFKKDLLRVITVPYTSSNQQVHILQIAVSQSPAEQLLHNLVQAMVLGIPLVLVFTSFVGRIFVQRILDPIEEITRTAERMTHEDLSSRVKSEHLDTEIEYLVASFNDMISRLEKSFKHINEFSSQVAHELKTPIAIMKGESELALSRERSKEDYKTALRINLEETDRMRKIIEDLLLLARLDYQPEVFKFELFDFIGFFWEIWEQAQILASSKGLTVQAKIPHEKVFIRADKLHLRRMFFNIIDNALKFTVPPGEIRLQVILKSQKLLVLISDTGVGIPQPELPKIFEKFYHADRTGQNQGGCTGLGLSIAQSILKIHKGHIHVTSKVNQGTTFHIMLPV